ncbi:translational GTPase TypA [Candidatus Saccharibacteria bacterium]|nr:translational GTPase TypA [Candidatus Saccharibacteria bacterium]MCB9817323.1 translational GTPase TypA [Candidatus Nomurabacteria bacterium]HPD98877.1 translational GTPase TypA [Candidatus Saccharibacteria bacterium]
MHTPDKIRNIAVIAHVDHGKTTIVDGFLKQSHTFRDNQAEMQQTLLMDSGDQERERGITITAKITAVHWNDYRINIIDTPGHADFSGEVERTLNMADGCLLIVDAQEGPMPQTKFVLSKALQMGLKPIVIINKIDKPGSRIFEVKDELDNLFLELAVNEDQLHYPIYYSIGREGKAWDEMPEDTSVDANLNPIFDAIIADIPAPDVAPDKPFQLLVTALSWDNFQGKYAVGRVSRGSAVPGMPVALCKKNGSIVKGKIEKIYESQGLTKLVIPEAISGDIVSVTGVADAQIGETIADINHPEALPVIAIEPPTLQIYLGPNTSPFKGKEGDFTTTRQISDRLQKELETNVGLRVEQEGLGFKVSGRGELHLSVLIEAMRREGYEFEVGRPQVVTMNEDGVVKEPIEHVTIEVPSEHVGAVQMELGTRRAELQSQHTTSSGAMRLTYVMPTRAMLGMRNVLLTSTKGTVIMNSISAGYEPLGADLRQLRNGVLIAWEQGTATPYALQTAQERGTCFIGPGANVYAGQIIGLNTRSGDLEINVAKEKHLTNMRSSSSDGVVQLTPPVTMSLEQCIDFIENDELLEVTPKNLRLRKKELNHNQRKRKT